MGHRAESMGKVADNRDDWETGRLGDLERATPERYSLSLSKSSLPSALADGQ